MSSTPPNIIILPLASNCSPSPVLKSSLGGARFHFMKNKHRTPMYSYSIHTYKRKKYVLVKIFWKKFFSYIFFTLKEREREEQHKRNIYTFFQQFCNATFGSFIEMSTDISTNHASCLRFHENGNYYSDAACAAFALIYRRRRLSVVFWRSSGFVAACPLLSVNKKKKAAHSIVR